MFSKLCNGSDITEFFSNLDEEDIFNHDVTLWYMIAGKIYFFLNTSNLLKISILYSYSIFFIEYSTV